MEIKLMSIEDYDNVYELWTNTQGMGMRSLDDSFEGIKKFLKRNPNTNFIAQEGDKVIGVLLCGHDGRRAYIYHVAVNNDYRSKGIGRALVNTVLEALREEEVTKVALVAFAANTSGNKFWEAVGFVNRGDLVYRNFAINNDNI